MPDFLPGRSTRYPILDSIRNLGARLIQCTVVETGNAIAAFMARRHPDDVTVVHFQSLLDGLATWHLLGLLMQYSTIQVTPLYSHVRLLKIVMSVNHCDRCENSITYTATRKQPDVIELFACPLEVERLATTPSHGHRYLVVSSSPVICNFVVHPVTQAVRRLGSEHLHCDAR